MGYQAMLYIQETVDGDAQECIRRDHDQCEEKIEGERDMHKMQVWWNPQVGTGCDNFYVPVESVEEAKKVMDILAMYDCFQYNHNVKPDYSNCGGLETWNEETECWEDWVYEDEDNYIDDVDDYIEEKSPDCEKLKDFTRTLIDQVEFDW